MQVLNSASITYYQILPDGLKKELSENSNLVETTLTPHAPPVKPEITYYTPSSRRFPPSNISMVNWQYFWILSWLWWNNHF